MKSVIMIAHGFPPEGNAGAYRPLRFARHLPPMGWEPTVITLDTRSYERYDPGLLTLVPNEVEVIRARNRDWWHAIQARRARRIQEKAYTVPVENSEQPHGVNHATVRSFMREAVRTAEAWVYHPDTAMCWIRPAVESILKVCARKPSNVIWATGGPWSAFVVAQRASQLTGVPYVLDFRDPWTLTTEEFEGRRPAWAKRRDRRTLYGLLRRAQAVIFRFVAEAECYWRAYPGALNASRIHFIPNGYEGPVDEFVAPGGDKCMILYTGTLISYQYDTLLQALFRFKKSDPVRASQLRLLFVGEAMEALANEASTLGLSELIMTSGPMSFAEINCLQSQAHALLVLGRPPAIKGHEILAGAKLFSYLKTGRPIIGIVPADETKKILHRIGLTTVADVNSPSDIVAVIRRLLDAWSERTLTRLVPDPAACEAYSAQQQTAALVRALEGTPPAEPFVPGSVEIPPSLQGEISDGGWVRDCRHK
jgi:hypothetical protein